LGTASLLGFGLMDLIGFYEQNFSDHPIMTVGVLLITLAFFSFLMLFIRLEMRHYHQLRIVEQQNSQLALILSNDSKSDLIDLLKQRTPAQATGLAAQLHKRFWHSLQNHHTKADVWQLYQTLVLTPLNEQARTHIKQATLQGSGISLLSPNDLIHTSILLWRSMKLVKDLAMIYGIRAGVYGNWHLLKLSLQHALIQQGSDLVLEASLKQLSEHLLAKVAEKGAQAATTGFLVRRLGLATMHLLTINNTNDRLE
jgi:putative membrane protein